MTNAFSLPPPPEGVTFVDDMAQAPALEQAALPPPPEGVEFLPEAAPSAALPPPPEGVTWADDPAVPAPVAGGSIMRGFHGMVQGGEAFAYALGMTDADTFAANLVRENANIAAYPKPESQRELEQGLRDEGVTALWTHAAGLPSMLGEMVASSVASIPVALGGAAAGGAAGTATAGPAGGAAGALIGGSLGVGAAAAMDDFGRSFNQYLQESGIDLNDVAQVRLALNDANLVNEAIHFAGSRAGVSGVLNTAGAAIGGKFTTRFFTPETSLFSKPGAKFAGGITGISVGTQAATTAGQQVVTGQELDYDAIATDAFLAGLANVVPMAIPGLAFRARVKPGETPPETLAQMGRQLGSDDAKAALEELDSLDIRPPEPTPFSSVPVADLDMVKQRILDEGPERARPQEWNNFLAKRQIDEVTGEDSGVPTEVIPSKTFDSDAPVSKDDIVRMVEERQLVVEEGERVMLPETEGVTEVGSKAFEQTLTISKESFTRDNFDPESPVVASTRGTLQPVAQVVTRSMRDAEGKPVLVVEEVRTPEEGAPVTSDVEELVVQRMMRWAAANGYADGYVSWPQRVELPEGASPGAVTLPVKRVDGEPSGPGVEENLKGVDRIADQVGARRVSLRVGATGGAKTKIRAVSVKEFAENPGRTSRQVEAREAIKGVAEDVTSIHTAAAANDPSLAPLRAAGELAVKVLREIEAKFSMKLPTRVFFTKGVSGAMGDFQQVGSEYHIRIHLEQHPTAESLYTTLLHEFGHAIAMDKWGSVDHALQHSIMEAWRRDILDPANAEKWNGRIIPQGRMPRPRMTVPDPMSLQGTMGEHQLRRRAFVKTMQWNIPESDKTPLWGYYNAANQKFNYELSFAEYFAEQVAKWAITSEKPMGLVNKFFSSLYHRINSVFTMFRAKFPEGQPGSPRAEAAPEIQAWLDDFVKDIGPQFATGWFTQMAKSMRSNLLALRRAGNPTGAAVPQTPATTAARTAMQQIFGHQGVPAQVSSLLAEADRMTRTMQWLASLPQVAKINKHIAGLQLYKGVREKMDHYRNSLIKPWMDRVSVWRGIGREQKQALNEVIREYTEMTYRTPQEVNKKIHRLPTQAEMDAIFLRHGLNDKSKALFAAIRQDFLGFLDEVKAMRIEEAMRIRDPLEAMKRVAAIEKSFEKMAETPYFPAMRFGEFTLTIRDSNGHVIHFETFESQKMRDAASKIADTVYGPAFTKTVGILPKDVKPMLGMPPQLLDAIQEKLGLSKSQSEALDQLKFELAPSASFRHRFQMKNRISGYSEDFMRSYAHYGFHGSSFLSRVKYLDELQTYIKAVRVEAEFMPDGTARGMIANYMSEHLQETVIDVRAEWSTLRAATFHWMLGFNPASAALNLTQTPLLTHPYLSNKFGDLKATAALAKAMGSLSTFYRASTLEQMTDIEYRLLTKANNEAIIQETMAPTLAGTSEERNLIPFMSRSAGERAWFRFSQASAWMFSNAEKLNRRVAFRAGMKLGMADPANPHMNQLVKENAELYHGMIQEGFSDQEARAYIAGKDAVEQTQFVYASWARPKLLRGRKGAILMFQSFTLNTLFSMWNNPGTALRSMIIMLGLGGAMGLPGAEDVTDMAKVLAWQVFGKDFNLEKEMREFIVAQSEINPDVFLHGASRYGFGIPQLADMMGNLTGMGDMPVPVLDMSRQVGLGQLSPIKFADFLGPVSDPDKAIADTVQRASGAGLSVGFNIYRAMFDTQLPAGDPRRWMKAMPRALANAARAWDTYSTGMDRSQRGTPIQTYDPQDGEQLAEIASMALGFQPLATTQKWGPIAAMAEAKAFWTHKREILLMQLGYTFTIGDSEQRAGVMKAIRQFNEQLPRELGAYRLTSDAIRSSMETRVKNFNSLSRGLPINRKDRPLMVAVDELHPEVEVGRRSVK